MGGGTAPQSGPFQPGADGSRQLASTAYGQGAARMHAMHGGARLVTCYAWSMLHMSCGIQLLPPNGYHAHHQPPAPACIHAFHFGGSSYT